MRLLTLIAGLSLFSLSDAMAQPAACVGHLLTLAPDGTVRAGSRAALIDAVRSGAPIRVGWSIDANQDGVPEVRHWADAAFLSEWQGEVFAQLDDIARQSPRTGPVRIELPPGGHRWSGLLGTTGVLHGAFTDGSAPTDTRVDTTWCLASCPSPTWSMVYQHDANGTAASGTKEALFDAVRRGSPIRFGWGAALDTPQGPRSVEHAAEPVFLTIMNGTELFVQLPEHVAQTSYLDPAQAVFEAPSVMWRGLMGSNGAFDAVYVDRATGREVRRLPQRARLSWFALQSSEPACRPQPVTLAVPGGVRRAP
jgi:hypothetical protein